MSDLKPIWGTESWGEASTFSGHKSTESCGGSTCVTLVFHRNVERGVGNARHGASKGHLGTLWGLHRALRLAVWRLVGHLLSYGDACEELSHLGPRKGRRCCLPLGLMFP